ncbi:SAM-dependent methyltransferase [Nocardiopsis metallicus]|uniref:O-methyltransferase involved in polyketide biosynthesis n=1 Tax=Nocardiopsis metallicus TaxID=179819 RepID=A0A840WP49_9ACTN|nr:SAM-dependent methyltransferase [Nocardiopsis metallicus]MBB5491898.1 O-methyltransferase involved in polyketide biosynthesis [Nocardiopsis metallicus]
MSRTPHDAPNTAEPHSARIYNYWLGGKDNYPADRAMGDQILSVLPMIGEMAVQNRAFLQRAVRYLVEEQGIRQFLDIGTGLPTADNTHEVAQRAAPDARIVYVDNDPLVLAHARALLTSTTEGHTAYVDADLRDPDVILRAAAEHLDLSRPVGLVLLGLLFHIPDESVYDIVRELVAALPSGSHVVVTHSTNAATGEAMEKAVRQWNEASPVPIVLRSPEEIERFFEGLELVEPGLVSIPMWRPAPAEVGEPQFMDEFGAVARKP